MAYVIVCAAVWLAVIIIIPFERIRELKAAILVAFIWMVFVDNISTGFGYYSYSHTFLFLGNAPVFQNLAEAGAGILMLNWLKENSITKLLAVVSMGLVFVILHSFYNQLGLFRFGRLDTTLNFVHHIAALSIFTWLSLAIIGEETVYSGRKTRMLLKNLN